MSEPKTETFDRLLKFMSLTPAQRDEALFLQSQRFKSILESEGVLDNMRDLTELMNGTKDEPGVPVRLKWLEEEITKLAKSNAKLQKALYICTGAYLAIKMYLEFKPHP
jgi:hypothetical protein